MSEYLIQDRTLLNLAEQTRRISGTTDTLNTAEVLEKLSRIDSATMKTDGTYYVEVRDFLGNPIKSGYYNKGDICALPEPPVIDGYTFETWSSPVPTVGNFVKVEHETPVAPLYTRSDGCLCFSIRALASDITVEIVFNYVEYVDWGDGVVDEPDGNTCIHTYSCDISNTFLIRIKFEDGAEIDQHFNPFNTSYISQFEVVSVHIPSNIKIEDEYANSWFSNTSWPNSITFGSRFTGANLIGIPNSSPVSSLVMPSSTTSIHRQAFYHNTSLKTIVLNNGLTSIGYSAFQKTGIEHIIIPATVTSVGEDAFYGCTSLHTVIVKGNIGSFADDIFTESGLKNLVITYSESTIPFSDMSDIATLVNSNGLKIYVPDNLLDSYKSNFASYDTIVPNIKPLSEYAGTTTE